MLAKYYCKSEFVISKIQRMLKAGYVSIRHAADKMGRTHHYSRCASLSLKGLWLEECCSATDTPVMKAADP